MKKVWIGIAAGVLVLAIAGGSFWGGMVYGKAQQANQFSERFSAGRFGAQGGQFPEAMVTRQAGRGNAASAGGVMGTIQSIEGSVLVIESNEGTIRVQTTDTTLIEKTMPVGVEDLAVDEQVVVAGVRNDDGSITARSVTPIRFPQAGQPVGGQ